MQIYKAEAPVRARTSQLRLANQHAPVHRLFRAHCSGGIGPRLRRCSSFDAVLLGFGALAQAASLYSTPIGSVGGKRGALGASCVNDFGRSELPHIMSSGAGAEFPREQFGT